jgi:hypothetical protein
MKREGVPVPNLFIKYRAMKVCEGVEVDVNQSPPDRGQWSASRPGLFVPRE